MFYFYLMAVIVDITGLTGYACSVSRIRLTQSSFVRDRRVKTVFCCLCLLQCSELIRIFRFIDSLLLNCAC